MSALTKLSVVAAMASNRVIGINNTLPWHLPADLKHFRAVTMGKPVIMGRKTYESIGKPLPGRENIIVTRNLEWSAEGCVVVHSLQEAIARVRSSSHPEACIIGGSDIYQQALAYADLLYLTEIDAVFQGDAFFPERDATQWEELSRESHIHPEQGWQYHFVQYGKT